MGVQGGDETGQRRIGRWQRPAGREVLQALERVPRHRVRGVFGASIGNETVHGHSPSLV